MRPYSAGRSPGAGASAVDLLRLRLAEISTVDQPATVTVDAVLRELARVVAALSDVDGSGVMVTSGGGVRFVDAVSTPMVALGLAEERFQQGPCRDSHRQQASIVVDDVAYDHVSDQWPQWFSACRPDGVRSLAAVPLLAMGRCWGVVSAGRRSPTPWNDHELSLVKVLADVAASHIAGASHSAEPAATLGRGRPSAVLKVHIHELADLLRALGPVAEAVVVSSIHGLLHGSAGSAVVERITQDAFLIVRHSSQHCTTDDGGDLLQLARDIQAQLRRLPALEREELSLTASIGVAAASDSATAADLFLAADQAMQRARHGPGGAIVITAHHAPWESRTPSQTWAASQGEVRSGTSAGSATTAVATSPGLALVQRE